MKRIYTPAKKRTILIVDDDQVFVQVHQEKFRNQGFKVEVVSNGHNALQRLGKDPVDLVIFDLCLPGMNGVGVLENVRSEFSLQALPVIAFSNAYLGSMTRAALQAGATKCVTKAESTPDQMVELVRELLGPGHSNAAGAAAEVGVSNGSGTREPQSPTEFQQALVTAFLLSAPETLARLRARHQAFARADQEDLRRTELFEMHRHVRTLAGSTGLLGFQKIARVAGALEALLIELHARPNKSTPSVIRTVAQAIDTLASLFDQATELQLEVWSSPKILVVDDEIISRETICSALEKAGLRATSLDDSLAAQRLLQQDHFDLIFLDVEMPGQSGLDLCVNIREMATNRATPVVFVTAHSDFGNRAQSTLSGGNDFIAKPFLLVELAVKALTWLFRGNPQGLPTVTPQDRAPAGTDSHGLQSFPGPAALSDTNEDALEPNARSRCAIEREFLDVSSAF
jgi:CheY-like chemotaxis protein